MKSVLDVIITGCKRSNLPGICISVNLLTVLQTDRYKRLADTCRGIADKKERTAFKLQNVPVITVSGLMDGYRNEPHLKRHSGLICLDLDGVEDITTLKQKVSVLPFVAYCGLSISGTGLFAIVPIPESTPEEHKQRYAALETYFIKHFGITGTLDPQPKSVAACRYVSYDPQGYFNHNAAIYTDILLNNNNNNKTNYLVKDYLYTDSKKNFSTHYTEPFGFLDFSERKCSTVKGLQKVRQKSTPEPLNLSDYRKVWLMIVKLQKRQLDFAPDYADYLRLSFSLAAGLGEAGRDAFHAVCEFCPKYNYKEADMKFNEALKSGNGKVTLGTFFQWCKDYGLMPEKKAKSLPVYVPVKSDFENLNLKDLL